MRKIILLTTLFILATAIFICKYPFVFWLPDDISPEQEELPTAELNADFYFLNKKIDYSEKAYLATGRIYLPLYETIEAMGGKIEIKDYEYDILLGTDDFYIDRKTDTLYPKKIIDINGTDYISLSALLIDSNYEPVFDTNMNRVDIFYSQKNEEHNFTETEKADSAYLRLEDIMADGLDPEGYYDDVGLEKLRAISDYLYDNNQKFYVAWIPLYKNPAADIENDLTKDFNLYNASFLYTLDYISQRNGKIGLHGYSHQYDDDRSAAGFEFGKNTPYSNSECVNRMLLAKKTARDLGYEINFFEFPHYSATAKHLRYAEKYFDVIYQRYKSSKAEGKIFEKKGADGKIVKYVPTPADYIVSIYDIEGISSRIDDSIDNGWIVSLFYHPKMDFDVIYMRTEDNTRKCYVPEISMIYRVCQKIFSENLTFEYF